MWKILLSKSHFDGMRKTIAGKCDWQKKVIWINDNFIHTEREDKIHIGKIDDIFSLTSEQRFIIILNHEAFHAIYHKRVINFITTITFLLLFIFLFLLKLIIINCIITFVFGTFIISMYVIEEKLAYKHDENYNSIDRKMFARLL